MTRQVLLLTIDAPPLPVVVPIVPVITTPAVDGHVAPALAPPTSMVATVVLDAVQLVWLANGVAGSTYVIEAANDLAGVPGAFTRLAVTGNLNYTAALAGPRWLRVLATLNGRVSEPTQAALCAPMFSSEIADELAAQGDALAAEAAERAAGAATLAQQIVDERNARQAAIAAAQLLITQITDDSILSPDEKPALIRELQIILNERPGILIEAAASEATTKAANYDAAVNTLVNYLATLNTPVAWNNTSGNTALT